MVWISICYWNFLFLPSFSTLFIKTNSWQIFESIKALEIKTSTLNHLDFGNNIVLSCFFLIDLYFSIPAVIAQIYKPITELVIPILIPTKETKTEMEIHSVIVEITISKWSI